MRFCDNQNPKIDWWAFQFQTVKDEILLEILALGAIQSLYFKPLRMRFCLCKMLLNSLSGKLFQTVKDEILQNIITMYGAGED